MKKTLLLIISLIISSSGVAEIINNNPDTPKTQNTKEPVAEVQPRKETVQEHMCYPDMSTNKRTLEQNIEKYTQIINTNPKDTNTLINALLERAKTHHMLENYKNSEKDYTRIIKLNPNHPFAHFGRSDANFYQEKYQQAIFDATQAIKFTPNNMCSYLTRAAARAWQDDFMGAIFDYTKAIEINPNESIVYYYRAMCKYWLNDYEGTLTDVKMYLKLEPNPPVNIEEYEKYLQNFINENPNINKERLTKAERK